MRYRLLTLALAAAVALLVGCASSSEVAIAPLPAGNNQADLGLGPGVRPLSFGPGDKSAPSWSPDGSRISFILDGYVVDKPLDTQDLQRWTTKDFGAEEAEYNSKGGLTILGQNNSSNSGAPQPAEDSGAVSSIYQTVPRKESFRLNKITGNALVMIPGPDGKGLVVALKMNSFQSGVALIGSDGWIDQLYKKLIGGQVTGLSLSPKGDQVVLSVRGAATFALYVLNLSDGSSRVLARLKPELEVFGAPQWTSNGIYYVAGDKSSEKTDAAPYKLYRIKTGSNTPEPASGVGEDFIASSLRASPDGKQLAVIGRRNPNSLTNLYIINVATNDLQAVTSNDDMEIKTGPEDLAWSHSGKDVAIIASGAVTSLKVHAAPASSLLADFYNLYEVPVNEQ